MIETREITQTQARDTAIIRLTIPRAEIHGVMGPGIAEVMATVAARSIAPAGPVFSRHARAGDLDRKVVVRIGSGRLWNI